MNTLILDALRGVNNKRAPVWLMRQAGRYLPEYQAIRKKFSLLELFHNPEMIAEITLQPVDRLGVDGAIIFSDILVILEVFGIEYDFIEGRGPVIKHPLRSGEDVKKLVQRDVHETLAYVEKAIQHLIPGLKVPLLGFCGAPFTIASYLIEGGASKEFKKTKQWLYTDPESFHLLLEKITTALIEYLHLQVNAGVSAVQVFDSWANILGHAHFHTCSLGYVKKIVDAMKARSIPVIIFCRGSSLWANDLAALNPSGISLDWNSDMLQMRKKLGAQMTLQGNLDPAIFYGTDQFVIRQTSSLLQSMHGDRSFICNLGHGMLPDAPVEKVQLMVDCVKSFPA